MYKLMTLAAVLVALALAPILRGIEGDDVLLDTDESSSAVDARIAAEPDPSEEALTCEWACEACTPEQGCKQICTEIGDCGSTCGVLARCDAQHAWSDEACACVAR